jgi:hypothetical protein
MTALSRSRLLALRCPGRFPELGADAREARALLPLRAMETGRVLGSRLLATMVVAGAAAGSACTGDCYLEADPVRVEPATRCLDLYAGHSRSDPGVCGAPDLHGTNQCEEALTLPPSFVGAEPMRVDPGQEIFFSLDGEVPPGITVRSRGEEATDYFILATLGDRSVTITVSVHED